MHPLGTRWSWTNKGRVAMQSVPLSSRNIQANTIISHRLTHDNNGTINEKWQWETTRRQLLQDLWSMLLSIYYERTNERTDGRTNEWKRQIQFATLDYEWCLCLSEWVKAMYERKREGERVNKCHQSSTTQTGGGESLFNWTRYQTTFLNRWFAFKIEFWRQIDS